jgi:hypothetical protein
VSLKLTGIQIIREESLETRHALALRKTTEKREVSGKRKITAAREGWAIFRKDGLEMRRTILD